MKSTTESSNISLSVRSPSSSSSAVDAGGSDMRACVGTWTGRTVFVTSPTLQGRSSGQTPLPSIPPRARNGTAESPISITSSPSASPSSSSSSSHSAPSSPLPRPRAVPSYSSPISRTAYTPPRAQPPRSQRQASSPATTAPPPHARIHPFFSRSRSTPLPPPPTSQRPRMIAEYSSTSESQSASQETGTTGSTFGSQSMDSPTHHQASPRVIPPPAGTRAIGAAHFGNSGAATATTQKGRTALTELEIDRILDQVASIDLSGKFVQNPRDAKWKGKGKATGFGAQGDSRVTGHGAIEAASKSKSNMTGSAPSANTGSSISPAPVGATRPQTFPTVKASAGNGAASTQTTWPSRPAESNGKCRIEGASADPYLTSERTKPTRTASAPVPTTSRQSSRGLTAHPTAPTSISSPELFDYRQYTPTPRLAYTTSPSEADDLLSCLRGNVLGVDLEWPVAGMHKVKDPTTGVEKQMRIGMTWDDSNKRWAFGQGRTALVQICDERLIVLIHLKDRSAILPKKVVEIMQDPKIYKTGVQIRGDGNKLYRDFPGAFPEGISSLLELSYVARQVDPINTGPGATLIALAKLCQAYTGKALDKDGGARKSNWMADLAPAQVNYAANDVYASLQIYLSLKRLAEDRGVVPDLDAASNNISAQGVVRRGTAIAISSIVTDPAVTAGPGRSGASTTTQSSAGGPTPAQGRALDRFRSGLDMDQTAEEGGIKRGTVEGYICRAILASPEDTLDMEEKRRVVLELQDKYVVRTFRKLIRNLRRDIGEAVGSDTEVSEEEEEKRDGYQDSGEKDVLRGSAKNTSRPRLVVVVR